MFKRKKYYKITYIHNNVKKSTYSRCASIYDAYIDIINSNSNIRVLTIYPVTRLDIIHGK